MDDINDLILNRQKMTAALEGTAKDIMKRIDKNLQRLEVGEYNRHPHKKGRDGRMPGTMRRSIYWQVFNATNGDEYKIKFWMEAVANYVALAVQGNYKGPSWTWRNGGLPAAIATSMYGGIDIGRINSAGQRLRRKAKPFIGGEIRVHGRMLFDRLVERYAYLGNMVMASALDVREIAKYVDANQKTSRTAKINRRTGKQDFTDLRSIEDMVREMIENRNNDIAALTHSGWTPGAGGSVKGDFTD